MIRLSEQIKSIQADLRMLRTESENHKENIRKIYDRIDDIKDRLAATKEKVYENTIEDIRNSENLKIEIMKIAGVSGSKQGAASGKKWGAIAIAVASAISAIIKYIS